MRRAAVALLALTSGCSGGGVEPPEISVTLSTPQTALVPGEQVQLVAVVSGATAGDVPAPVLAFTSLNPAVASVSPTGLVTGIAAGNVSMRAAYGDATSHVAMRVDHGGMITPAGGTLSGYADAIRLVVPPAAVAAPTAVRLTVASNPVLDPTAVVGSIYSIAPEGLTFAVPAMVQVRFALAGAPFGLPPQELRLRRFAADAWSKLPAGSTDVGTLTASAEISGGGLVSAGWVVPDAPCTSPESRQFDFWVGSWNATLGGAPGGTSDITLAPGGCAVFEHFVSGGIGRSISFYVPGTGRWYQTYVDNAGYRLPLEGMFVNGAMDLRNPSWDANVHGLTRWSAEGANVRQRVAMLSTNGGASYGAPQYDFLYVPR